MWRKFLGVGIPLLILGAVLWIVGVAEATTWHWGAASGATALVIIGVILSVIGGMLTNAGLIGAVIGADVRGLSQRIQTYQVQPAPPQPGAWGKPAGE
jgi:hypothetical protein